MPVVELSDQEWQQVIAILATGPWNVANPILTKLANQLQIAQAIKGNATGKMKPSETKTEGRA